MANTNSVQMAKLLSSPVQHVGVKDLGGRVRRMYFDVTAVPTGAGDTMTLGILQKGYKVTGGRFWFSVAQGATATTAIGVSGTTGKYRAAAITNALTGFAIADSIAENQGLELTADETIIATNAAAVWTAASFKGYIEYVVD